MCVHVHLYIYVCVELCRLEGGRDDVVVWLHICMRWVCVCVCVCTHVRVCLSVTSVSMYSHTLCVSIQDSVCVFSNLPGVFTQVLFFSFVA